MERVVIRGWFLPRDARPELGHRFAFAFDDVVRDRSEDIDGFQVSLFGDFDGNLAPVERVFVRELDFVRDDDRDAPDHQRLVRSQRPRRPASRTETECRGAHFFAVARFIARAVLLCENDVFYILKRLFHFNPYAFGVLLPEFVGDGASKIGERFRAFHFFLFPQRSRPERFFRF